MQGVKGLAHAFWALTIAHMHVLDADNLLPAMTQASKNLHLLAYALSKRAAVDPNAAIRRSDPIYELFNCGIIRS